MDSDELMKDFFGHFCDSVNNREKLHSEMEKEKNKKESSTNSKRKNMKLKKQRSKNATTITKLTDKKLPIKQCNRTAKSSSHLCKSSSSVSESGIQEQNDVQISIPELSTSSGCLNCGYWLTHNPEIVEHKTCICSLLGALSVCCFDGYRNLMKAIPSLMFYAPCPSRSLDKCKNIDEKGVVYMKQEEIINFSTLCSRLKVEIIRELLGQSFISPIISLS
jgi:hypothetical protein